jgi:hypothetical protein
LLSIIATFVAEFPQLGLYRRNARKTPTVIYAIIYGNREISVRHVTFIRFNEERNKGEKLHERGLTYIIKDLLSIVISLS